MNNKKVILFDFDGVLAHTLEVAFDIHKVVNSHFTWEEFETMSDGNFHKEYRKKLETGEHTHPENYPEKYNQNLQSISCDLSIKNSLEYLHQKYLLYIVSSTRDSFIKDFLTKEGVDHLFSDILGYDTHHLKVPKIKSILEREEIHPRQCVFVTDTIGDIKEARVCGVSSIGVLWGLHKKGKLEKENPYALVETPEELVLTIERFFDTL